MPNTAARLPVLFDTDIGSDIDDAIALAYLLKQPRCDLLGITTVSGDVNKRAAMAEIICASAGRKEIPIHAGASHVLLTGPGQPDVPQFDAVSRRPHRSDYPPNTAIEFMRKTIRSRPGEVSLLAVGPMTNVGLLFATDPEIPGLLRQLTLMCGVFTGRNGLGPGSYEWNAMVDPIATAIVFNAAPPLFTSVGLEVTTRCVKDAEECRRRFMKAGGPLEIVAEAAEVWFKNATAITFHDPLAATTLFQPDLCNYQQVDVQVETVGLRPGSTYINPGSDRKRHRIAVDVDPARFFDEYFTVTGG